MNHQALTSLLDSSSVNLTLPSSPGYDEIRVDLAKEVFSSRLPAIEGFEVCVVTRVLLQERFLWVWPRHANVFGQEVNEYLQI